MGGELWISGVHEAAHIVVARRCGIPLRKGSFASLLPDKNRPESVARTVFDFDGKDPEQIIQVLFAGPIAEANVFSTTGAVTDSLAIGKQILRIFPNDRHALAASRADLASDELAIQFVHTVEALAIRPPHPGEVDQDTEENPTFHLLLRLSEETRELVNQNWPLIEGLAGILLERRVIPAQEVTEFFQPSTANT